LHLQNQIGGTRSNILEETIREAIETYGSIENIPPSYLGGNELLNKLAKLGLLKDTSTSVYTIVGHGCDLNYSTDIVPENCYYVHKTKCGIKSDTIGMNESGKIESNLFYCLFSEGNEILYDPITNIDTFKKLNMDFTINKPGDNYVNNRFTPFVDNGSIWGLYKIGDIHSIIDNDGYCFPGFINDENNVIRINIDTIKDGEKLSASKMCKILVSYYKNSLLPTQEDIITLIKMFGLVEKFDTILNSSKLFYEKLIDCINIFYDLIIKHFKFDIKTLFNYYPGIYYNLLCRIPCSGIDVNDSFYPLRRQQSLENLSRLLNK